MRTNNRRAAKAHTIQRKQARRLKAQRVRTPQIILDEVEATNTTLMRRRIESTLRRAYGCNQYLYADEVA